MVSTDYSKSEEIVKDIFKTINEIQMHVTETQEEFIFFTISKWVNDSFNMSIKKDDIIINFCIQERYFRRIYGRGGER